MKHPVSESFLKRGTLWPAAVLAVVVLLSYINTFNAPFVFDDRNNILENPCVRVTEITPASLAKAVNNGFGRRPLANYSFAANFFFHGYDVRGYHAINLIIHLITALLVGLVARRTLLLLGSKNDLVSFWAAALWVINPVHTQSVTYIVQRMNSLAALFFMLALLCYIFARQTAISGFKIKPRLFYVLCLAAAVLGLAAKQIVAVLPVILFLYEWFFFQNLDRGWLKKRLPWAGLAVFTVIVLAAFYLGGAPLERVREMYARQNFTMFQRLLTESGVIIYYLSLLFFPHPSRLNIDYDFPVLHALNQPHVPVLAISTLLCLIIMAVYAARKDRLLAFSVVWFLVTLVIESSFIGLDLIFEHRTYLPSVFLFIAVARLAVSHIRSKNFLIITMSLAVMICGFWTHARNTVWMNATRLWADATCKSPTKARPHGNLGFSLLLDGKKQKSITALSRGLELNPFDKDIHNSIAIAFHLMGDSEKALAHCRTALDLDPGFIEARNTQGYVLREQGNLTPAEACFNRVLKEAPDNFEALMNMGLIKQQQGDTRKALPWFRQAVDVNPVNSKGLYYLGSCLATCDELGKAVTYLKKSLRLDTRDYRTHCMLGVVLMQQGKTDSAVYHLEQALELNPSCTVACLNLARTFFKQNDHRNALIRLNSTLQKKPRDTAFIWQAVQLLTEAGRLNEAAGYMESLIALKPDNPKLLYNLACLYARQKDTVNAVNKLKQAVEKGYNNWSHLKTDDDLRGISHTAYYKNLNR